MDNLELNKLYGSDKERLSKILRAFVEMQTKTARMIARDDLLKIFGTNDGRKYTSAVTLNYLTVVMDYLGESDRCYCKPEEVVKLLASTQDTKIMIPSYAQPLGWDDEIMDKSIKENDGVPFDPQQLKNALSYLLRPDFEHSGKPEYFGIIFHNNEMMSTNGQVMLFQNGLPVITSVPRLLGYDCAMSLYSILRTPYVQSVQVGITKKSSTFGIRVELDDGSEMFYWSKPKYAPIDSYKDPRPPVDPKSVGFVVHGAFLEALLAGTINAIQSKEKPVVYFYTTGTGLAYIAYGADEMGIDQPRGIYQGEIPMVRSMPNLADVAICVKAENLLQAIKGLGESVQFIVPHHPLLGFEVHPIDPFYVNCNPNQFALLAPFILEREKVVHMEKLKRKANNAMEDS